MVSGKTVLTYTPAENETVELSGCQVGDARCFALLCETEKDGVTGYKTLLYSEAGSLLKQAESKSGLLMPTVTLDLLVLDDAVFRANGTALEGAAVCRHSEITSTISIRSAGAITTASTMTASASTARTAPFTTSTSLRAPIRSSTPCLQTATC